MVDYRNSDTAFTSSADATGVSKASNGLLSDPTAYDHTVVCRLKEAALSSDPYSAESVMTIAAEAGISAETMADCYIPIVARELGEAWCVDELGFADVTIGSARLQAMLRELGPEWTAGQTMQPDASTVLLLVPEGQYHTLGAMILSGQLRRVGLSVRLVLGASTSDVKNILEMADFDAVFISAVRGVSLEILRKIVNCIHVSRGTNTPVVVGGTALELHDDIVSLTGADYVTNSADEAISLCNLRTRPRPVIVMDK